MCRATAENRRKLNKYNISNNISTIPNEGLKNKMVFKLLSVVFVSSFPFLFTLNGEFVFDDSEAILKNKDVRLGSWMDSFQNDYWGTNLRSNLSHKSYRPLTIISFRLNYILNKNRLEAYPFKRTNILCHIVCCLLVWLSFKVILNALKIDKKSKKGIDISYFATLLFAVHPVHVEAICGIVGRADLLSGVAFFIAFLLYHKAITHKYSYFFLSLSIIMATASMLFKENGITVLGFCLFYDLILHESKRKKKVNICKVYDTKFLKRIGITLVSIIIILCGRWIVMGGSKPEFKDIDNPAAFANNLFSKIATFNYIYFLNFLLFLWPQWLCYDWSMGCIPLIKDITDYRILMPISMYLYSCLFLTTLLRKHNKRRTKRLLLLSVALTVIPFLPASNIFFPVGFVIAERILYIPSAGYSLIIAIGLNKMISRFNVYKIGVTFYIILLLSYGLKTWRRSYDWQNEYRLFMSGLSVCPLNAKVHYNVAKVADVHNRTEFALCSYKEALRLYPEYYQAMNNLANMLKNQRKYAEAEQYLRKAIEYKHDFPAAWMNLGIVLASTDRLDESQAAYRTALQYRKIYPDCFYNLGNLYLEMNKTDEALENWLQAVTLNTKHVLAWTNLIALLDNTDQLQKAIEVIPKALKELPDSASVNFAVANIYGKIDRFTEAEQHFLRAIRLFGSKAQAIHYANLGVLYHRWKRYNFAEAMYKNALNIDPSFKSAQKNLHTVQKLINK